MGRAALGESILKVLKKLRIYQWIAIFALVGSIAEWVYLAGEQWYLGLGSINLWGWLWVWLSICLFFILVGRSWSILRMGAAFLCSPLAGLMLLFIILFISQKFAMYKADLALDYFVTSLQTTQSVPNYDLSFGEVDGETFIKDTSKGYQITFRDYLFGIHEYILTSSTGRPYYVVVRRFTPGRWDIYVSRVTRGSGKDNSATHERD